MKYSVIEAARLLMLHTRAVAVAATVVLSTAPLTPLLPAAPTTASVAAASSGVM